MNLQELNENITMLEKEPMTFSNCQKLASLYLCRAHMSPEQTDVVRKELKEILPQYSNYIETRKAYQMHRVGKEEVIKVLGYLCQEISEFLQALYSASESKEEQELIKNLKFFQKST